MRSLPDLCSVTFNALCLRDLSDFLLFPGKDEILQICPWPHLIHAFEMFFQEWREIKKWGDPSLLSKNLSQKGLEKQKNKYYVLFVLYLK